MSYDYNALLTSLASHRAAAAAAASEDAAKYAEALQESLQVFDTLSGHCPMTPLLWMQYAHDMSELMMCLTSDENNETARQTRLETLEVGLTEFPGSAILQLHYCELLVQSLAVVDNDNNNNNNSDKIPTIQRALLRALDHVGKGSHRNHADIVVWLYRLYAQFAMTVLQKQDVALASMLQRARTPLKDVNDSLQHEVQLFFTTHNISADIQADFGQALEDARRWEAKAFARLQSCEETVDVALYQEQISYQIDDALQEILATDPTPTDDTSFTLVTTSKAFAETVLQGKPIEQQSRYWMGLGGGATAQAFLQYATACRKLKLPPLPEDDDDDDNNNTALQKQQHQLVLSVFERGLAECPTVEALWLAYLKHLTWLWNNPNQDKSNTITPTAATMKTIATRAVRNCPFSLALVQQQLHIALLLANTTATEDPTKHIPMEPDELLTMVHKALDSKFLPAPAQALDLYLTAMRVVQRRILSILATSVVGYNITTKQPKQHKDKDKKPVAALLPFDEAELLPSQIPKTNNAKKNGPVTTTPTNIPLDEDAWEDVQDLCADMQEMLEDAMSRLNKDHASWTEGRALLLQEWALMQQIVIVPLLSMSETNTSDNTPNQSNGTGSNNDSNDMLAHLEKVIRLHLPPHPDSYRALIQHVLHYGTATVPDATSAEQNCPGNIVSRLRQVRGLYQKAIQSVGKPKVKDSTTLVQQTMPTTTGFRDYETALNCLCHDYQEFERLFGSEQSLADATRLMQKKLQKTTFPTTHHAQQQQQHQQDTAAATVVAPNVSVAQPSQETTPMELDKETAESPHRAKRKESDAGDAAKDVDTQAPPPSKKRKTDKFDKEEEADQTTEPPKPPHPPPQQPKKHHKVKIGQIFHRAHPYTVRISNLAVQTAEMDLVESFRQEHKCGAVVHARIQREKGKEAKVGISKGWGLLQFEERESVEKALELDQKVELHGKVLHVERSHVPAVGIVPPGMHRPHHGAAQDKNKTHNEDIGPKAAAKSAATETKKKSNTAGILAFRPRGVTQKKPAVPKNARPKVKLNLGSGDDDANEEGKK